MTILSKSFCKKYNEEITYRDGRFALELYDTIDDVEESWSLVSAAHDVFYSAEFLRCLELYPATGIKPYYCLVKDGDLPVGIIYFQSKNVKLKENLRKPGTEAKTTFEKLYDPIKHLVVSTLNFNTIICGNLLLTGKYGFYFKNHILKEEQFYLVTKATEKLSSLLEKKGISPGLTLVKDFFYSDTPLDNNKTFGFTKFTVQPKMLLDLSSKWKTFDDYLDDMKSKYRVRARKAIQKGSDISKVIFSQEDIATHRKVIHQLYKNISDQADFNAFVLHEAYFENLKAALGKNMTFTTYWRHGKMVAFFTSIKNFDVLDAHFLGYDPDENAECQIYLNMLYDLIKEGIDKKVRQVDMSRTAIEIKSTVGAVPNEMFLYLKHSNTILNKAVDTVLGFVKPSEEFVIRSPFRDDVYY